MKIINAERGTGKTIKLIKKSAQTGYPILVATKNSIRYIQEKALALNVIIPMPICVGDLYTNHITGKGIRNVLVDEMDWVLDKLLQHYNLSVEEATITSEMQKSID